MPRLRQFGPLLALILLASAGFGSQIAILRNGYSIRHERRAQVGDLTRLYTGADTSSFIDVPTDDIDHFEIDNTPTPPPDPPPAPVAVPAAPPLAAAAPAPRPALPMTIDQIVGEASTAHNIDPDFINSVIKAESGFNIRAVSPKGAQGLMQLMPGTADGLGVNNAFDPRANVEGGTRYLRFLLEKYNGDVVKALAAYNAGPNRVDQYHGVPPYYETQAYIARIIRDYNRKKLAQQKAAKAQPAASSSAKGHAGTTHASSRVKSQASTAVSSATSGR